MKVGIRFGMCNNPPTDLLHCECTRHLLISHHHNPPSTYNTERATKPGKNWLKWLKMGEKWVAIQMCHVLNAQKAQKKICYGTTNL